VTWALRLLFLVALPSTVCWLIYLAWITRRDA
jgi:hypothetical protein